MEGSSGAALFTRATWEVLLVGTFTEAKTEGNSESSSMSLARWVFRNPRDRGASLLPRAQGDSLWRSLLRSRLWTQASTAKTSSKSSTGSCLAFMARINSPRRNPRATGAGLGASHSSETVVPDTETELRVRMYRAKRTPFAFRAADRGWGMRFPRVARFIFPVGSTPTISRIACSTWSRIVCSSGVITRPPPCCAGFSFFTCCFAGCCCIIPVDAWCAAVDICCTICCTSACASGSKRTSRSHADPPPSLRGGSGAPRRASASNMASRSGMGQGTEAKGRASGRGRLVSRKVLRTSMYSLGSMQSPGAPPLLSVTDDASSVSVSSSQSMASTLGSGLGHDAKGCGGGPGRWQSRKVLRTSSISIGSRGWSPGGDRGGSVVHTAGVAKASSSKIFSKSNAAGTEANARALCACACSHSRNVFLIWYPAPLPPEGYPSWVMARVSRG
mmetsp:Transcript_27192/g.70470  ORF Transcript_27192/g.70470 Transcript_27192/m.70470 type:complete len:446 (-) Transcript_27192:32-1369(-)